MSSPRSKRQQRYQLCRALCMPDSRYKGRQRYCSTDKCQDYRQNKNRNDWYKRNPDCHPGLLPANPGRHPVRRALRDQLKETGVTIHSIIPQGDKGPILARKVVPIKPGENSDELLRRLYTSAGPLLVSVFLNPSHKKSNATKTINNSTKQQRG